MVPGGIYKRGRKEGEGGRKDVGWKRKRKLETEGGGLGKKMLLKI